MVLSNNSGSRLAMDSQGIGREALGYATEAMPSIYLVVPWPPGTQGQLSLKSMDAEVNIGLLKS